jgi:hypothetical protein
VKSVPIKSERFDVLESLNLVCTELKLIRTPILRISRKRITQNFLLQVSLA